MSKAGDSLNCNEAAGEAIWTTLTDLLRDVIGFLFYLALLSSVSPLLIAVIAAASLAGYCINRPLAEYRYRHREEEGECNRLCSVRMSPRMPLIHALKFPTAEK